MPIASGACVRCEQPFTRQVSQVNLAQVKYCGRSCYFQDRVGKPRIDSRRGQGTCRTCAAEFPTGGLTVPGTKHKGAQFCSNECRRIGHYRRGRMCAELRPFDAAYLAGFMDGEGSFMLQRGSHGSPYPTFRVSAAGAKEVVIRWISEATGVGTLHYSDLLREKNPNWAPKWEWSATADAAVSFTRQLLP